MCTEVRHLKTHMNSDRTVLTAVALSDNGYELVAGPDTKVAKSRCIRSQEHLLAAAKTRMLSPLGLNLNSEAIGQSKNTAMS